MPCTLVSACDGLAQACQSESKLSNSCCKLHHCARRDVTQLPLAACLGFSTLFHAARVCCLRIAFEDCSSQSHLPLPSRYLCMCVSDQDLPYRRHVAQRNMQCLASSRTAGLSSNEMFKLQAVLVICCLHRSLCQPSLQTTTTSSTIVYRALGLGLAMQDPTVGGIAVAGTVPCLCNVRYSSPRVSSYTQARPFCRQYDHRSHAVAYTWSSH